MKLCREHGKELKGPNKRGNYWHVINYDENEFCNYSPEEYNALPGGSEQGVSRERVADDMPAMKPNNTSHRIERMHSQEMALRYFKYAEPTEGSMLEHIKELTNWFLEDLEN